MPIIYPISQDNINSCVKKNWYFKYKYKNKIKIKIGTKIGVQFQFFI